MQFDTDLHLKPIKGFKTKVEGELHTTGITTRFETAEPLVIYGLDFTIRGHMQSKSAEQRALRQEARAHIEFSPVPNGIEHTAEEDHRAVSNVFDYNNPSPNAADKAKMATARAIMPQMAKRLREAGILADTYEGCGMTILTITFPEKGANIPAVMEKVHGLVAEMAKEWAEGQKKFGDHQDRFEFRTKVAETPQAPRRVEPEPVNWKAQARRPEPVRQAGSVSEPRETRIGLKSGDMFDRNTPPGGKER